jgi:hypothetical protein
MSDNRIDFSLASIQQNFFSNAGVSIGHRIPDYPDFQMMVLFSFPVISYDPANCQVVLKSGKIDQFC